MRRLKRATIKDREFVRKLRNDMRGCIEQHITKKEHLKWWRLKYILKYIIRDKKRIGFLRVNTHAYNEITIMLVSEYRNKGIGQIVLKSLPKKKYRAQIQPENKISLQCFKKSGFTVIDKVFILRKENSRSTHYY